MNFDLFSKRVSIYEQSEPSVVAIQLQKLIAKNGFEIFKDNEKLASEINTLELSCQKKAQLLLVFSCSTLSDYVLNSKSDLNLVDVDNILNNVVFSTGLSYEVSLKLVSDVLFACGLSFPIEYGPQLCGTSIERNLHALIPSNIAEIQINQAEKLIEKYNNMSKNPIENNDINELKKCASEAVTAIQNLCAAGVSKGFYLLGRCYIYGECGTEIDEYKGNEYMKIAADQGLAEAVVEIGDYYYNSTSIFTRDYTLAHYFYSRPGAMAMGADKQKAMQDIYQQYTVNKTTLIFSGIIIALMITFMVCFNSGIFSDSGRLVIGIILTALSGLTFAASIVYNRMKKYNGLRFSLAIQYFIWALYTLLLVLA